MQKVPPIIEWEAHEFEHREKSSDWYWGLGVLALVCAATALFFNNVILAILVVVAAGVVGLVAQMEHQPTRFSINQRGIKTDDTFYPFSSLESFWINISHETRTPRLLIKSQQFFTPLIVLPLEGVDPEDIQEIMMHFLPQEPQNEPLAHHIFERLGF